MKALKEKKKDLKKNKNHPPKCYANSVVVVFLNPYM